MTTSYFTTNDELTDELAEQAIAMTGMEIRCEGYNREAGLDAIRHYSYGLGDDNPLFCDRDYARSGPYADIVAPPTYLYTIADGGICPGLPGLQPIYTGAEWHFNRVVKLGEPLTNRAWLEEVRDIRRSGGNSHLDRFLLQIGMTEYLAADGEVVATQRSFIARMPRRGAVGGLAFEPRVPDQPTAEQREEIGRRVLAGRQRRGHLPLRPADVCVGDVIPAIVKEVNLLGMVAYYGGCPGSPGYKACEMQWVYRDRARHAPDLLPNQFDPEYFASFTIPSLGHTDPDVGRVIGMPGAYNNGPQRVGWAAHLITNWVGDAGRLIDLNYRMLLPEVIGDVVTVSGTVTSVEGSRVAADLVATNQLGETTSRGTCVVVLPSA